MPSIANANKVPSINAIFGGVADPVPDSLFNYKFDFTDSGMSYFPSTPTGKNDMDYFRSAPACLDTIGGFFNGTSRYNTGDAYTKIVGTESAFTSSFWIDTSSQIGGLQRIMVVGSSSAGGDGFYLAMQPTGSIRFRSNGINTNAPTPVNDGKPHFILVTYDGTTLKIYVDNAEDLSVVTTVSTFNPSALTIGATAGGVTGFFSGVLDDIRYYDRVLDTNERTALYNYRCDFNPSQITTSAWFDAQDQTTITEALGLVSQWDDKGSTGTEHLIQATGANQMSTGLQQINGLNTLSSTTADRFMQNLTFPVPSSGNIAITFVCKIDGQTSNLNASSISMNANNDFQLQSNTSTQFDGRMNASNIGGSKDLTGGPFTGPDIWAIVFDWDNSIYNVYVNGVNVCSSTYDTNKLDTSQQLRIMANRGANNFIFGLFGEMIIQEDVTDSTRLDNEGYLAWKWGLVADLPSGHPYKASPPKI
tara:strand:+ start:11276 stop:12703 length:1428 start_codon:yes stop_codon:yes gene_type:complete